MNKYKVTWVYGIEFEAENDDEAKKLWKSLDLGAINNEQKSEKPITCHYYIDTKSFFSLERDI